MVIVGGLLGLVLVAMVGRLVPGRPSPLVQLGRLDAQHTGRAWAPDGVAAPGGVWPWLGHQLSVALARRGFELSGLRQDLELTGQDLDLVMGKKVLAAVTGLLLSLTVIVALTVVVHVPLPLAAPMPVAAVVAVVFFFLPDIDVHKQAAARRDDFRRALGSYLDLVALEMAAAAAPAQALTSAARVGAGWPMALLRDTLFRAARSGRDQWGALSELGGRIGVPELRDLGGLIRLVEHDGAQVRATLSQRAAGMRRLELADAEGQAQEQDVSMRLAQLVIAAGFLVFLAYPAFMNVMSL